MRLSAFSATLGVAVLTVSAARAAGDAKEADYDPAAVAAALDQAPGTIKPEKAGSALEVPPPPPRKKGVVLESSLGMMVFLGKLKTISPPASMLHVQLGYEPFRWLMVFGESDVGFTSTRYTSTSRGYALYAFGAGARLTVGLNERVSAYGQFDFGMMKVSGDVLSPHGFYDAENMNGYFGATGGIEWYQADPHYALSLYGGVRSAQGLTRAVAGDSALSALGAVAIRYTF